MSAAEVLDELNAYLWRTAVWPDAEEVVRRATADRAELRR